MCSHSHTNIITKTLKNSPYISTTWNRLGTAGTTGLLGLYLTHLLKVRWVVLLILALRRAEAGGSEFKASKDYLMKPCLQTKTEKCS